MEKHEILYEFQFGFRKGHSTSQAIAEIADNLRNAIDHSPQIFLQAILQINSNMYRWEIQFHHRKQLRAEFPKGVP